MYILTVDFKVILLHPNSACKYMTLELYKKCMWDKVFLIFKNKICFCYVYTVELLVLILDFLKSMVLSPHCEEKSQHDLQHMGR